MSAAESRPALRTFTDAVFDVLSVWQPIHRTTLERIVLTAAEQGEEWARPALKGGINENVARAVAVLVGHGRVTITTEGYRAVA